MSGTESRQSFFLLIVFSLSFTFSLVCYRTITGQELPWSVALGICFLSQAPFHAYDYSYDLHLCALVIGGLYVSRLRPFWGSLIMSLSILVRPSSILLVIPLVFAWHRTISSIQRSLSGIVAGLLLFLLGNYLMFGGPFTTAYSRISSFLNGEMVLDLHPLGFNWEIFFLCKMAWGV